MEGMNYYFIIYSKTIYILAQNHDFEKACTNGVFNLFLVKEVKKV